MTPRVWNKRIDRPPTTAVYVGRPSKWGNPFKVVFESDRADVLERYRAWLRTRPQLVADARAELAGKDLVCWCAPRRCHADVLLRVAAGEDP